MEYGNSDTVNGIEFINKFSKSFMEKLRLIFVILCKKLLVVIFIDVSIT